MNFNSQLARLILDYHREEPDILERLSALLNCRVQRRWRTIYIHCANCAIADNLVDEHALIAEPLAQLRMAQTLCILVRGRTQARLPVTPSYPSPHRRSQT